MAKEIMTKRVLIVDDNEDNRKLLFFALMTGDYEIHQAESGQDVPDLLEKNQFDLALLDVELPDVDGLKLAEQLHEKQPQAVVIMLSANDSVDRLQQARRVGASAYVIKPFNLPKVLAYIKKFEEQPVTPDAEMQVL
jgi:DNA-binding response OmpR family regulator